MDNSANNTATTEKSVEKEWLTKTKTSVEPQSYDRYVKVALDDYKNAARLLFLRRAMYNTRHYFGEMLPNDSEAEIDEFCKKYDERPDEEIVIASYPSSRGHDALYYLLQASALYDMAEDDIDYYEEDGYDESEDDYDDCEGDETDEFADEKAECLEKYQEILGLITKANPEADYELSNNESNYWNIDTWLFREFESLTDAIFDRTYPAFIKEYNNRINAGEYKGALSCLDAHYRKNYWAFDAEYYYRRAFIYYEMWRHNISDTNLLEAASIEVDKAMDILEYDVKAVAEIKVQIENIRQAIKHDIELHRAEDPASLSLD